jgi:hypothetical protein
MDGARPALRPERAARGLSDGSIHIAPGRLRGLSQWHESLVMWLSSRSLALLRVDSARLVAKE